MRMMRMVMAGATACALMAATLPAASAAEEETAGNNLSAPLAFSELVFLPPLNYPESEQFSGEVRPGFVVKDDPTSAACMGALQQDAGNVWEAPLAFQEGVGVSTVDWGDNLESMDPNLNRTYTRVEVALKRTLEAPVSGYDMCWISGSGQTEMWGAQVTGGPGNWQPVKSDRTEALVYTAGARLTIQRIVPGWEYSWNSATKRWEGLGADAPYFSGALHEDAADGPGSFGAEVTIAGNLSYGYLWETKSIPQGEYRLTFSLERI